MFSAFQKISQAISRVSATVTDAYFNLVTLLLNTSSTNGAQNNTFLDSSSNNFTITRNGNTTQGTFTPFSQTGWSNYFDGSSYLTTPNNAALNIDTTYSAEIWLYPTVSSADQVILSGNGNWDFLLNSSNVVMRWFYPSYVDTGVTALQLNTWHHIAFSISGGRLSFYVNGTRTYTNASVSITNGSAALTYLGWNGGNNKFYGYLSNARITKGSTPYDPTQTTITVPTAPLTAITNTQFLTCQSNRFIDNSTNAFALTVNGTPSVQAFSPFAPTAAYSTSAVGGSGYFDGSGDYLTGPNASGGDFSTGSFTISCWFYPTTLTGGVNHGLMAYADTGGWNGWQLQARGSTKDILFEFLTGSAGASTITGGSIALNAWNYVAIVRSGSTVSMYVNSTTAATSTTNSTAYGAATSRVIVGADRSASSAFVGYISNAKLVKQANAPASIPTAPDTNTTNTSFLLNYTNAGIYDSAAKNDLETVGNAQVSTTQAKWGTTSMYFDGNGDWLLIPNNQMLNLNADFTIDFWIYLNSTTGEQCIFHNHNSDNNGILVSVNGGGAGKIRFGAGNGSSFYVLIDSSTAISVSTWTYVACTRSGSTWTIYINGSSAGTATSSSNPTFSTSDLIQIGRFTSGTPNALNAYIDDFRITKYARTITASPTAAFPLQ